MKLNVQASDAAAQQAANCAILPGPGVDLHGCDLSNANLIGANLSNANLTGANLNQADLYQASLLDADLSSTTLVGTIFAEADLADTKFTGCSGSSTGVPDVGTLPICN